MGSTATPAGTYGGYRGSIAIISGVTHGIERPIYIMRIDTAVTNFYSNNVSTLLADGSGGFSAPIDFSVGDHPWDLVSEDFNKNNNLDLAVVNLIDDNISILLGDGNGSFSAPTNFSVGNQPFGIASGDFNEDDNLDLAITNDVDNVSILIGDGNGNFSTPIDFFVGNGPRDILSKDFNEDDNLDLAITNDVDNVSILIGDGNGDFSTPIDFSVGNGPESLISGDFNEDDHLDLAVANRGSGSVSILLQTRSNTFQTPDGDFTTLEVGSSGTYTRTYKNGTKILFDNSGLQTTLIDPNNNTTNYTYDAQDRLTKITDPAGLETDFVYNGNYLFTVTTPDGRVTTFQHNGNGDLIQVDLPDSSSQSFGYDTRHLMTSELDRNSQLTTHIFDDSGRIVSATLPDGTIRSTTNSQQVGWVDPASGLGTQANPAAITRPNDAASSMIDGEGRITQYLMGHIGREIGITDTVGLFTQLKLTVMMMAM